LKKKVEKKVEKKFKKFWELQLPQKKNIFLKKIRIFFI